ncbi:MAG: HNH endonuclease [Acidimicrobiia bacterium]|nr:HNH endonuclease [Acidimicrobiia bacterium]
MEVRVPRALVLNTTYEPVSVVSTRRAVVLVLNHKASVVAAGRECFHSERTTIEVPSVVRLVRYVKVPYHRRVPPTRRAVLARDAHICQYCEAPAESIDHVLPRSRGGVNDWENVVACCRRCNVRKGDRLPHEIGFQLARAPKSPWRFGWVYASAGPSVDPHWLQYLAASA